MAKVTRKQWPVGQGIFSSGSIYSEGGHFEYVYDCGSNSLEPLKASIRHLRPYWKKIDALFISHLDSDHVNGIEHLLAEYQVKNVFLPYLDSQRMFLVIGHLLAERSLTANSGEMIVNPGRWFGERGVANVYRILAAPPSDDLPDERSPWPEIPLNNSDAEDRNSNDSSEGSRLNLLCSEQVQGRAVAEEEASVTTLSWKAVLGVDLKPDIWALVPFVPPVPESLLNEFYRAARSEGLDINKGSDELLKILKDRKQRKKLKTAYRKISSNHNFISMCLYSGPLRAEQEEFREVVHKWPERGWRKCRLFLSKQAGWIGTGDAMLRNRSVLDAFEKRYRPFFDQVGSLMCPHHGSWHNYSNRLIQIVDPDLVFAPAGQRNGYGHPHKRTINSIRHFGIPFIQVSEVPSSKLVEEVRC